MSIVEKIEQIYSVYMPENLRADSDFLIVARILAEKTSDRDKVYIALAFLDALSEKTKSQNSFDLTIAKENLEAVTY